MSKQTEAQRLSAELESTWCDESCVLENRAAALLRRQDELLKQALEALDAVRSNMRMNAPQLAGKVWGFADEVSAAIRAHLEAMK